MAMQQGKVHFRYQNCYAYKKGADGQPEIIPEEAETIKIIYTSYLEGKSALTIIKYLNYKKIKSHAKDGIWRISTIQSILKNERYCGDVLLQKTFVTDPISKKVNINNGELPKYLIKNNHPAIVSREIYDKVQEERAKRGSIRKVSKASKTELSRYSGLYALNEILICGECLSPYRRVVWTKRNGEKQAVWRCISRLDYGTKYCPDSVTLDEESLHKAIVEAINKNRGSQQTMIPYFLEQLKQSYDEKKSDKIDVEQIENRIAQLKNQTMAFVTESIENNTVGENEGRLKAMSDEIKGLSDIISEYKNSRGYQSSIDNKIKGLTDLLQNETEQIDKYNDILVRQLIDTIKVMGEDKLLITFKCGVTYEQSIDLKVRKLKRVA